MNRRLLSLPVLTTIAVLGAAPFAAATAPAPGPLIPETEFSETVVTVTSPGDFATAVDLRTPFPAGTSALSANSYSEVGSQSYTEGEETSESTFDSAMQRLGADDVVEVRPDGSTLIRYTQITATTESTYSNPDHDGGQAHDASAADGVPVFVLYGADRQSRALYEDPATTPTAEQLETYVGSTWSMTVPVPDTTVGVGATWTWNGPSQLYGVRFDVAFTATIDSIDGDRYLATVTYATDIPTAGALELDRSGRRRTGRPLVPPERGPSSPTIPASSPSLFRRTGPPSTLRPTAPAPRRSWRVRICRCSRPAARFPPTTPPRA